MPQVNHLWAAQVLNMKQNPGKGPDLLGDKANCEVKFTLIDPEGKYPVAWTVLEHQMQYHSSNKTTYWALGTYELSIPVRKIRMSEVNRLEDLVVPNRELFIVPWDWMNKYAPSRVSGKTALSEWVNTFRYPKKTGLPKMITSVPITKGTVHFAEGTDISHFSIHSLHTSLL